MGYNTTIVVMNDAISQIEGDPLFGKKLAQAMREASGANGQRIDIPAGNHANAAHVVECHHADATAVITVGGNLGIAQVHAHGWRHHEKDTQVRLLEQWAEKLGMQVTPK